MLTNVETSSKFLEATSKAVTTYDKGFVFSALYGSQNYGLATPTSDVDVKVAFLPSPQDVLLTVKRQAYTHTENGSTDNTVLAKDLRDVFAEFYKQNLNFLEVLATPYFFTLDSASTKLFEELREHSNDVARYYERGFYLCTCGLFNKLNKDFELGRYDHKKLVFGLYLRDFVNQYYNGTEFNRCFTSPNQQFYLDVKQNGVKYDWAMDLWSDAKSVMDEYFQKANQMSTTKNDAVKKWMDEMLYDFTWKYVVKEGCK